MGLFKRLKQLAGDTSGNALAIGAAALPLVIGGAGLALDTVQISLAKRQLQRAADSAALAGAHAINQSRQPSPAVTRDLQLNNDVALSGAPVVENAPSTGPYAGNMRAVRVQLSANRSMSFFSLFNDAPTPITVSATAAVVVEGDFCMLSLEDGNETGVSVGGNATVNIGCGISTNSRHREAIRAYGSSTITASPIMAVGGVPPSDNYSGSTLMPYSAVQQDPFANLPVPTVPSSCNNRHSVQPNDPHTTIGPSSYGVVCYRGMDIKGPLTLRPGIYIIDGSSFDLGSQANLTANNVTIILTSSNATSNPNSIAGFNMNGGAVVNMSASTSGPYRGILFYQDPRAPIGRNVRFNGHADSFVEGALYFPRSYFNFNGTAGMETNCIQLVARRLEFNGNGSVTNECPPASGASAFQAQFVRLVG